MFSLRRVPGGLPPFTLPSSTPPCRARPLELLVINLRPPADVDVLPEARPRGPHVLYPPVEHVPLRHGELLEGADVLPVVLRDVAVHRPPRLQKFRKELLGEVVLALIGYLVHNGRLE